MPTSATYELIHRAMEERKQMTCTYQGHQREFCPIILGYKRGAEAVLAFQFGGASSKGSVTAPLWKCLNVVKMEGAQLRDGPWLAGESHQTAQSCIDDVDLDVNPTSPYSPRRRLRRRG